MSVSRQLRSYVSSVSWLLRDAARGNRGRVVTVVLLNTLGALALAASFGGVVLLAQAMETGKPLAGQELTTARMIGAALIVVLIAIASGWLLYASEWMIARIAIEYQVHTARRIMRIVADPKHKGWPSLATGRPRRYVNGLAGLTCKIAALMVRLTLRSIYSAILLVAASVALVVVDPALTAMLVPVGVIYLVPLYFVNRRAARDQHMSLSTGKAARMSRSGALDAALEGDDARIDTYLDDDIHVDAGTYFFRKRLSDKRVQFVNTVFFVLGLLVIFVAYAVRAAEAEVSLTTLLLYVITLRVLISGLRGVTSTAVKLSRFLRDYGELRIFIDGVDALAARRAEGEPASFDAVEIRAGGARRWDSPARIAVAAGDVVWVVTPWVSTPLDLDTVVARLGSRCSDTLDLAGRGDVEVFAAGDAVESGLLAKSDGLAIVVTDDPADAVRGMPDTGADRVIVMSDGGIEANGDARWLQEHVRDVAAWIERVRGGAEGGDDGELELEDE